jgi:hypothetical protein
MTTERITADQAREGDTIRLTITSDGATVQGVAKSGNPDLGQAAERLYVGGYPVAIFWSKLELIHRPEPAPRDDLAGIRQWGALANSEIAEWAAELDRDNRDPVTIVPTALLDELRTKHTDRDGEFCSATWMFFQALDGDTAEVVVAE